MKVYWGSGGIILRILDLGTRWRQVVSFTPRPHYSRGKNPWYPLGRRLGGPHFSSPYGDVESFELRYRESNADRPVRIPSELSWIL
jgi:hypothetical protein